MASDDARRASDLVQRANQLLAPIEIERNRAAAFSAANPHPGHFIGMAATMPAQPETLVSPTGLFEIRPVPHAPGMVNLTGALAPKARGEYAKLGGSARAITHELWLPAELESAKAIDLASRIVYLLRVASGWSARAIGYADTSWNSVAGADGSVVARVLGEEWHQNVRFGSDSVAQSAVNWTDRHLLRAMEMWSETPFDLAMNAAATAHLSNDLRVAVSQAWAGIEALLGINQELVFRISLYLAALISDDLDERVSVRDEVRALYKLRSKAVHGSAMSDSAQLDAAVRSWSLLRRAIRALVELRESAPDSQRFDRALLGDSFLRDQQTDPAEG